MKRKISGYIAFFVSVFLSWQVQALDQFTPPQINDIYVIHFILDGTNAKVFGSLLNEGKLPNIKTNLVEQGAFFPQVVAPFPTTSTTSYQSFASGLLPGHAGIPHLERFDRLQRKKIGYLDISHYRQINNDFFNLRALENPDIHDLHFPTTLFELLQGHPTAAIYSTFHRGATYVYPKSIPFNAVFAAAAHNYLKLDRLALGYLKKLFEKPLKHVPRYTLVGLLSSDLSGHSYGIKSEALIETLMQFDAFIGDFSKLLEQRGLREKTFFLISSDHGMHDTGKLFSLQEKLFAENIRLKPENPREKDYTLQISDRGVSSTQIYLVRNEAGEFISEPITSADALHKVRRQTKNAATIDLLQLLQSYEEVEFLAVRNGLQKVLLLGKENRAAEIKCGNITNRVWCSYTPLTPHDPLGYLEIPQVQKLCDGKAYTADAWLQATWDTAYPDAAWQLFQIFATPRSGDAFVIIKPQFGFRKVKAATHGSLHAEDIFIPLVISAPDKSSLTRLPKFLRNIDLYPLILDWFGIQRDPTLYDGNLATQANPPDSAWLELARLEALFAEYVSLDRMINTQHFLRQRVFPLVPASHFSRLKETAQKELRIRSERVKILSVDIEQLKKNLKKTKKTSKRFQLLDEQSILKWRLNIAWENLHRLEDIVNILDVCHNPESSACRGF